MADHHETVPNGHVEVLTPEAEQLDQLGETKNSDIVGKAATIAVIGVGVALISAELIPGMIIGVAAAFLPGIGPKLKPLFKSTVRAGYSAMRKTREMMAEASEQMQDVVAEARADHEAKAEPAPAETTHASAA
jgi:hypothetical protein